MKNLSRYTPLLILFFLLSVIGFATYKINNKQAIDSQEVTQSFDQRFVSQKIQLEDFELPNLFDENDNFSKADFKGKKYSLINVFASWCTTCRAEHQILLQLKSLGIVDLYGVAWRDINQNTKKYLTESGNPFKKVAADNQALFSKLIGVKAVPETFLVDEKGRVVWRYSGNLEETAFDEIKQFLSSSIEN